MNKLRQIPDTGASPIQIQSTIYQPDNSDLLGQQKYRLTINTTPSNILKYTTDSNNNLLINNDGTLNTDNLISTINAELISNTNNLKANGTPRIIQITRKQNPDETTVYYSYILVPIIDTGNTDTLKTFCQANALTFGEYNCEILLNDINIPDNEIITKQNILRMQVIKDIGFKAHPENLYRAMYTSSGLNRTTLSVTMPKLNYYEQEGQLKYHDLKILLIPSTKTITYGDGTTLDQNTILTYLNASDCYLSETSITPELFDTQSKECHLITFNNTIPAGTYKAILLQPAGTTYKLFEEFPQTIQSTSEITITGIQPDLTDDTAITPKTINTLTLKLETLQKGKITITIDSDYFTGKTFSSSDNKNKVRRWIKIMKGNETILPKTEITTTYDDNGNLITEVKEDYDTNKITITFPEYYLTGSTEMPTQKPQLPEGEYKILIYQTNTASTPLINQPINLIQMPFNLTFYHHDHLGTTRYITNENGEILHTTDTLAYGEELTAPYENDKDEVLNTITFTGHEKDYETGLTYMLARYYSQGYGRFLSPDPGYDYDQLDPMSWNLYSYVRGNPITHLDPTGMVIDDKAAANDPTAGAAYTDTKNKMMKTEDGRKMLNDLEKADFTVYIKFGELEGSGKTETEFDENGNIKSITITLDKKKFLNPNNFTLPAERGYIHGSEIIKGNKGYLEDSEIDARRVYILAHEVAYGHNKLTLGGLRRARFFALYNKKVHSVYSIWENSSKTKEDYEKYKKAFNATIPPNCTKIIKDLNIFEEFLADKKAFSVIKELK